MEYSNRYIIPYTDKPEEETPTKKCTGWWIPIRVVHLLEDGKITPIELCLIGMIDTLSDERKEDGTVLGCWAGNRYMASMLGCKNPKSIGNMIYRLIKQKILVQENYNRRRYLFTQWTYKARPNKRRKKTSDD